MTETIKTSKYKYLNDPPVASSPFSITVDEDKCIGCGVCVMQCPCQTIQMVKRQAPSARQEPSCQFSCPAGIDIRAYIDVLNNGGTVETAWSKIVERNPFPAITGRVCPHFCESSCNRSGLDSALNINSLERYIGDYAIENKLSLPKPKQKKSEKVAVVGAGPAGMSCAGHLAMMGYEVTVFEAADGPGGMLTYAIPLYRLPQNIIDAEMKRVQDLGVEVKYGIRIGKDITLDQLAKDFKAVFLAVGAQKSPRLGIDGEQAENVLTGLAFLKNVMDKKNASLGKKVVVVGGGNTAVDAARVARRLGAEVTIVYRRSAGEMPAYPDEVAEAREEGVKIEFLCAPAKISLDGSGKASALTCVRMKLGEPDASGRPRPVPVSGSEFSLNVDTLIVAIGQEIDDEGMKDLRGQKGWLNADAGGATSRAGIFAGGDAVSGPATVTQAIGAGRRGALAIDAFLTGKTLPVSEKTAVAFKDVPLRSKPAAPRNNAAVIDIKTRLADPLAEVRKGLTPEAVKAELNRCLGCGTEKPEFVGIQYFGKICIACHNCEAICPQGALSFPSFYKVVEGRWAYSFDYPPAQGMGMPNPLQLDKPAPLEEIEAELTGVEKTIYTRRSVRVYKPDPVPKEVIMRVLEAGRFAPSAGNCQGWKFLVVTNRQLMDELSASTIKFLGVFTKLYQGKDPLRTIAKKALAFIKPNSIDQRPMVAIQALMTPRFGEGQLDVFFNAPVAIVFLTHHLHISEPELGMGICAQNMVLAAHSLGLGTCYVGFVSNALNLDPITKMKFRKRMGIEWPYDNVATVLTMGYPAVKTDKPVDREFPKVDWIE
ncbi:MAG: NAD(P)-binding protein [Thermodesulfobacteriota bacterium]